MKINKRRLIVAIGAGAGGLLAAAFLPIAVAFADEYDFTPDTATLVPTQIGGYPPLINEVTGAESWNISDATTKTVAYDDIVKGTDTETAFGSFTNDYYLVTQGVTFIGLTPDTTFDFPPGSQIDLANFGLGFENEWIDITSGLNPGISDLFITPFGDFELLGSGFSELSSAAA